MLDWEKQNNKRYKINKEIINIKFASLRKTKQQRYKINKEIINVKFVRLSKTKQQKIQEKTKNAVIKYKSFFKGKIIEWFVFRDEVILMFKHFNFGAHFALPLLKNRIYLCNCYQI